MLDVTKAMIAKRLKKARSFAGFSQSYVANKLGYSRETVSHIESAKRSMSVPELVQFADLYSVRLSWLICQDNEMSYTALGVIESLVRLNSLEPETLTYIIETLTKIRDAKLDKESIHDNHSSS